MRRPYRRRSGSRLRSALWALAILLLALPALGVAYLMHADLRTLLEGRASAALGRPVTLGSLRVHLGRTFTVEASDLRIADAGWSQAAEMIHIGRLSAVVYLPALLRGVVQYDRLAIEDMQLLLERRNDGARNWRFGDDRSDNAAASGVKEAGLALVPKNRRQFPDVKDLSLRGLTIVYRSEGRKDIRIRLDEAGLGAPDSTSPARFTVIGAYNGIPLRLLAAGGSFSQMRDASVPYPADFTVTSGETKIAFDGGIDEPLDFEGVSGRLDFDAGDFAAFLKLFDYERPLHFPVKLTSALTRDGDRWTLNDIKGSFKDSALTGGFVFDEGARNQPDAASVDVALDRFDVKTLVDGIAEPNPSGEESPSFRPEDDPATTLDARIAAGQVTFGKMAFDDVRLRGRLAPGEIAADELSLGFAGGRIAGEAHVRAQGTDGAATLQLAYDKAYAARLAKMAGLDDGMLSGALDGRVSFSMAGPTLETALAASEGQAVVAMNGGEISRSLLEKVSVDLRALARRNGETASIQCLLAVVKVDNGTGRILPLVFRTDTARLTGGGAVNLPSGQVDMLLRSDPKTTSFFALDLPLHIVGRYDDLSITPKLGAVPAWLSEPVQIPEGLRSFVRQPIDSSDCLK